RWKRFTSCATGQAPRNSARRGTRRSIAGWRGWRTPRWRGRGADGGFGRRGAGHRDAAQRKPGDVLPQEPAARAVRQQRPRAGPETGPSGVRADQEGSAGRGRGERGGDARFDRPVPRGHAANEKVLAEFAAEDEAK